MFANSAEYRTRSFLRRIHLVDDLIVEALCHNDTTIVFAVVQSLVQDGRRESTENVTCAKMHPCGMLVGLAGNRGNVKPGNLIAFCLPLSSVKAAGNNVS